MNSSNHSFTARPILLALFTTISLAASASADTPIFEATFDKPDTFSLQNGAKIDADSSGVSGKLGDKSYVADTSTTAVGGKGPEAEFSGSFTPAQNLDEITVTAWYKSRGTGIKDATTLFDAVGTSLLWDEKTNCWVFRIGTKPAGEEKWLYWFPTNSHPPLSSWIRTGEWTFFAASWKRLDKKVTFYQGSTSAPIAVALERTRGELAEPLSENPKFKRVIGNTLASAKDRSFDGSIDDVRFYPKALDLAAIESIRQSDLQNKPAP